MNPKEEISHPNTMYIPVKRFFDVVLTIVFSIPILFLIFLFAILVKIDSRGPAFYSQERVGKDLKLFTIYKLRSMKQNAESLTGEVWASENDPRVTRVGKFMRRTRIDELPQFLNVLIGDMSIIGPRPERKDLTNKFEEEIPGFSYRTVVKPGITGLAQVSGGYDLTPAEKFLYDKEYIEHFSFSQDISILLKTIVIVLTGKGAR